MNRVFGIILCIFSLVGLVSSPALAAISCAMQCQKAESEALVVSIAVAAISMEAMSPHCAEMAAAAASAKKPLESDAEQADSPMMFGMDCDCPSSCSVTAPAVLSTVDMPLTHTPNGDVSSFRLTSVQESFRSRLYRPPIA